MNGRNRPSFPRILYRRLRVSMAVAAGKVGIRLECRCEIENGLVKPKTATVAKIERLLQEHQISVSTAPHTPRR